MHGLPNKPSFFDQGFRPFFLGASLFAGLAIPIWLAMLGAGYSPPSVLSGTEWHAHEMVFGFFPAVLTGFLLTASPNWTGRKPIAGGTLIGLFMLWLAGRIALSFGGVLGEGFEPYARLTDATFLIVVALLIWREILAGKNIRNIPVCIMVSLVAIANLLFHAESTGLLDIELGVRPGLALIAMFISFIGGRVIPAFTRNWMRQHELTPLPAEFSNFDKIVLASTAVVLTGWVAAPEVDITGFGLFALAALHFMRLARWSGWKTTSEPLVLVLHVGYGWLATGFLLMGVAVVNSDILLSSNALHAFTAGAIGTMTLAIMSRASLGHSSRPLKITPATLLVYVLVSIGTIFRVMAGVAPIDTMTMVTIGGLAWSAGFLVFAFAYLPIFVPRLDRTPLSP